MYKLFQAIKKELLLLQRDIFGFIIIFLMPLILVVTITSIQHSVETGTDNLNFPILIVNNDSGKLSQEIVHELEESASMDVITTFEGKPIKLDEGKERITSGEYKILMVIPEGISKVITEYTEDQVGNLLGRIMTEETTEASKKASADSFQPVKISIYFDPVVNETFKANVKDKVKGRIAELEKNAMMGAFEKELDEDLDFFGNQPVIEFSETSLSGDDEITPNAVQHNLPAWALFAIFFIVMPLSINLVKEKNQGTSVRLRTLPVSRVTFLSSKIIVYLMVCMIQFYLMLLVSIYLFPIMGLPQLDISGRFINMSIVALFAGLAAVGFGILIGTIAKTHEQAAPFGATSIVILAAVGGLWFPVFAMPEAMQSIAKISPMNWGLEAFYDVLLRETSLITLLPKLGLLLIFFAINLTIAVIYERKTNQV